MNTSKVILLYTEGPDKVITTQSPFKNFFSSKLRTQAGLLACFLFLRETPEITNLEEKG